MISTLSVQLKTIGLQYGGIAFLRYRKAVRIHVLILNQSYVKYLYVVFLN